MSKPKPKSRNKEGWFVPSYPSFFTPIPANRLPKVVNFMRRWHKHLNTLQECKENGTIQAWEQRAERFRVQSYSVDKDLSHSACDRLFRDMDVCVKRGIL